MAERLLQAAYPLIVWNRTRAKSNLLAAHGAQVVGTVADAVQAADLVITMLESGAVVERVIHDAMTSLRPGTLVIDMSSTSQAEALAIAALLAGKGIGFIDAPVSGGVIGAEAGTLAIMAGGSVGNFKRAEALLNVLGKPTLVGEVGSGQLAKMCNQLIVGGTLNLVAEALLLAQAGGANPAAVRNALRGGFAESRILEVHGQRMLDRNFMPGGQVKSQLKDLENALFAATAAGIQLPVTELIARLYRDLGKTLPYADQSAVLIGLESLNRNARRSVRVGVEPDQLPT